MENNLITVNYNGDNQTVLGRELHEFLEVGTPFRSWFPRMCEYGFEESVDYTNIKFIHPQNKQECDDFEITITMAKDICRRYKKNNNAPKLLEFLLKLDNKELFIREPIRKEIDFGNMLDIITGLKWDRQYPIDGGKYRLDFKLGSTLIVEYDEKYHEFQNKKDEERIEYCIDWLSKYEEEDLYRIPVIRVKEGEEFEGIHKIILHLVGFGVISDLNNKGVVSHIY